MGAPTSAQFVIQAAIILLGMSIRVVPWHVIFDVLRGPPANASGMRRSPGDSTRIDAVAGESRR